MKNLFKVVCMTAALLLSLSSSAEAFKWSLKVDPGISLPLSAPQNGLFTLGGAVMVKALFGINSFIDVGPTVGVLALSASDQNRYSGSSGNAWQVGGGLRLKRSFSNKDSGTEAVSPWLDVDALYIRTGVLNRFGFAAAVGLAFPLDSDRQIHLGPFARYLQVVQSDRVGYDNRDAKTLTIGISLEFGSKHTPAKVKEEVKREEPPVLYCPIAPRQTPCPTCVVVVPEPKIVPKFGPVQFDWDEYVIKDEYYSLLDKIAEALKEDNSLSMTVSGHASSEGTVEHNQILSENRSMAVFDYLIKKGVSEKQLQTKWYGSSVPVMDNDTLKGRETNRRVGFIIIGKKGESK